MIQFIIKVPEGEKLSELPEIVQEAASSVSARFPSGKLAGTQAVDGYELKLVLCDSTSEQLQDIFDYGFQSTDENGDPILIDLELDWKVLADEESKIDQSLILPYFSPVPIFDEEGEQIDSEPVIDITGKIQTYAGRKWIY